MTRATSLIAARWPLSLGHLVEQQEAYLSGLRARFQPSIRTHSYSINVSGPVPASSPRFAVDRPEVLYPGLLVNSLFFYETQRDGPDFIRNELRPAPLAPEGQEYPDLSDSSTG